MLFELASDHTDIFRKRRPKVKGLAIDIVSLTDNAKQGLIVSLTRPADADIFYRLCQSTVRAASESDAEGQAVLSVLNHLERWRDFLSNARRQLLSPDEIRGLFAELTMIRAFVEDYLLVRDDVVSAWQGPLRRPQDFEFPLAAVEVKSFGGTKGSTVQISSEQQLQSTNVPLYLVAVELFDGGSDPARTSLNGLAKEIEDLLGDSAARTFRDRLAIAGYAEVPEYDLIEFVTGRLETYHVTPAFPAIRSTALQAGIPEYVMTLISTPRENFLFQKSPSGMLSHE
jgi:hypothetical protein